MPPDYAGADQEEVGGMVWGGSVRKKEVRREVPYFSEATRLFFLSPHLLTELSGGQLIPALSRARLGLRLHQRHPPEHHRTLFLRKV